MRSSIAQIARTGWYALFAFAVAAPGLADSSRRALLLDGVESIASPGVPGPLSIIGADAFAVVAGEGKQGVLATVVAAGPLGKGRVVAFGHDGYFGGKTLETANTGRLLRNAVFWSAGRAAREPSPPRVAAVRATELARYLRGHGFAVEEVAPDRLADAHLACEVLVVGSHDLRNEAMLTATERFVARGGGLIVTGLGWGWLQLNPGKNLLDDHPGNLLLRNAGIAWTDGTLRQTVEHGFSTDKGPLSLLHAIAALDALEADARGDVALAQADLAQATATVIDSIRAFPQTANGAVNRLLDTASAFGNDVVPSSTQPMGSNMALARAVLTAQLAEADRHRPEQVQAHSAGHIFPGSVPTGSPRVARTITVDTRVWGWHSTGLYAAAGDVISVASPPDAAAIGLRVRIGCHTDRLWHLDPWRRAPEIAMCRPLQAPVSRIASPVGGLLYIDVPAGADSVRLDVLIGGAVESPYFVLGTTSVDDWRESIRHRPAPWAELATDRVILSIPSSTIRNLDDPAPVLHAWNDILDACADLACRPRRRDRPERYVADEQISNGYMHAGYPIMTHLDAAAAMSSQEKLLAGQWGLFHELGHNHQSPDWTFEGTGEVTVNLFSLYVGETVCKLEGPGHPAVLIGPRRNAAFGKYVAAGRDFNTWKSDPFLALTMYLQLREAFGWEAFKRVFAEYRDLPANERPRTDQEKRDQWMVRFSRTVGRNLGPFFQAWGVPTTPEARARIAGLPGWWPEGFPQDAM